MMNPAAPADNANEAAWTATVTHQESYGDEEEITTTGAKPSTTSEARSSRPGGAAQKND